ncbi:MAG: thioredoxin family protein [Candidatus Omnitrophica bacterium]|nr:thioredoxin family protein [Candidatus Omnitrophota bacterium]
MKKFLYICFGIILFFQVLKGINAISWEHDYEHALQTARREDKPLLVYFYATWCGQCHKFQSNTLTDWTVKSLAKKFVCVKLDAEFEKDLAKRFEVTGYPTVIFLNTAEKLMNRMEGYGFGSKAVFRLKMNNVLKKRAGLPVQDEALSVTDLFF